MYLIHAEQWAEVPISPLLHIQCIWRVVARSFLLSLVKTVVCASNTSKIWLLEWVMIEWLIGWLLVDWLIDWLTDWLVNWFVARGTKHICFSLSSNQLWYTVCWETASYFCFSRTQQKMNINFKPSFLDQLFNLCLKDKLSKLSDKHGQDELEPVRFILFSNHNCRFMASSDNWSL